MEKNYRIIAKCDPYNARHHYHGGEILKKYGPTPVEWVWMDSFSTLTEAKDEFRKWAQENCIYYDDNEIALQAREFAAEIEVEYTSKDWKADNRWYDGAGWYHCGSHEKCWDGSNIYREDSMTWRIETYEALAEYEEDDLR